MRICPDKGAREKPEYILADSEITEPDLTDRDWADFHEGLALFNAGAFWDSHEAWERIWRRRREPGRIFFQGLIQLAAAHHQLERGIYHGVVKHCNNALLKLAQFPDGFLTLQVDDAMRQIRALLADVVRLGSERAEAFQSVQRVYLRTK